jgi:hypothetical protein
MELGSNLKDIISLIFVVGIIILGFGLTGLGYIPYVAGHFIDLLVVPVLIGSMIGVSSTESYIPALVFGVLWALMGSMDPANILTRITVALIAAKSYKYLISAKPGCPNNVYRATVIAIVAHAGICSIIAGRISVIVFDMMPELICSLVMLRVLIDKLRELHLLNGIIVPNTRKRQSILERVYMVLNLKRPKKPQEDD